MRSTKNPKAIALAALDTEAKLDAIRSKLKAKIFLLSSLNLGVPGAPERSY